MIMTAQGGTVILNTNGSFTYTAPAGFSGVDSFDYTLVDVEFGIDIATVILNVVDTDLGNGRPVAQDDVFSGTEDQPVSGNVLADNGDALKVSAGTFATVNGDAGDDKLYGQADGDLLKGGLGNDLVSGGTGSDELYGNDGVDRLTSGAGADKLYGGAGNDRFIFDKATGTSADKVMDFKAGDKLAVNAADYGLDAGALPDAGYFASGAAANVGHGRFLYTSANRSLAWDADGNAATANVVIATFDTKVTLSFADFLVI